MTKRSGVTKFFDPLTPLLGFGHGHGHHVRSFKSVELKRIAWLPVIHIDHGHISYRFQHKNLKIVVENSSFPTRVINVPLRGSPRNFATAMRFKKLQ